MGIFVYFGYDDVLTDATKGDSEILDVPDSDEVVDSAGQMNPVSLTVVSSSNVSLSAGGGSSSSVPSIAGGATTFRVQAPVPLTDASGASYGSSTTPYVPFAAGGEENDHVDVPDQAPGIRLEVVAPVRSESGDFRVPMILPDQLLLRWDRLILMLLLQ